MIKLRECPFCGDSPMIATANNGLTTIACSNCECEFGWFENETSAIERWNTRAERTCKDESEYGHLFLCSNCGGIEEATHAYKWGYCPNCGARVVGD